MMTMSRKQCEVGLEDGVEKRAIFRMKEEEVD
jgi:hypothetical protein